MTSPLAGLTPARQLGLWVPNLDPTERLARLRGLRAMVRFLAGPHGAVLAELLQQAETDESALAAAADALDSLAPLDMRTALLSYADLARPLARLANSKPIRA